MRIRRSAAKSALAAPSLDATAPPLDVAVPFELLKPPPPPAAFSLEPFSAPKSRVMGGLARPACAASEPCELNRSPWDLINDPSLSDPQEEDDLVDKYFVHVPCRASWLTVNGTSASMKEKLHMSVDPKKASKKVAMNKEDQKKAQAPKKVDVNKKDQKKAPKKVAVNKKKDQMNVHSEKNAQVKEEEDNERKPPSIKCRKYSGNSWHCDRPVSSHNSVCDYHLYHKRSSSRSCCYINRKFSFVMEEAAATSKPTKSSKPRKKKSRPDFNAKGFYYYA